MTTEQMAHWLAQAAVNISEGKHNTIEVGSPVHRALEAFCDWTDGGRLLMTRDAAPALLDACRAVRDVKTANDGAEADRLVALAIAKAQAQTPEGS